MCFVFTVCASIQVASHFCFLEKMTLFEGASFCVTAPGACLRGWCTHLVLVSTQFQPEILGRVALHTTLLTQSCSPPLGPYIRWIALTLMKGKVVNRYEGTGLYERMPVSQLALCLLITTGLGTLYGLNKQNQPASYVFWH